MNEEKELTKADWVLAKSLVRSWLMEKGVALTGVNGEASRSSIHRFKLDIEQRIVNTLTTARREAREEAFRDAGYIVRQLSLRTDRDPNRYLTAAAFKTKVECALEAAATTEKGERSK